MAESKENGLGAISKILAVLIAIISLSGSIGALYVSFYKVDQLEIKFEKEKEEQAENNKVYWQRFETKENNASLHALTNQKIEALEEDKISKKWLEAELAHIRELIQHSDN